MVFGPPAPGVLFFCNLLPLHPPQPQARMLIRSWMAGPAWGNWNR